MIDEDQTPTRLRERGTREMQSALRAALLNELVDELTNPLSALTDQNFGIGLLTDELNSRPVTNTQLSLFPWLQVTSGHGASLQPSRVESPIFTMTKQLLRYVNLDVQQFQPEEVSVKVVDGFLVVEAKHEERQDKHGYISRSFTRRYKLPKDINEDAINQLPSGERQIPITQTNQPALKKAKSDAPQENGKGDKMES
ncbi:unnamed protein product [Bemisia tabaci]|uniref:SHSP domain-containing protein n=1 Tax=Bemisia tabaci TaxID=7038 RepID=A0A9P0AEK8_BEMTA|nr:unnamed protein product [Bemisia tabaci]